MTNTNKIDMSTINYAKKQLKERAVKLELDNQPKPFTVKIKQHLEVETGELYNKGEIGVSLDFVRDGGLTEIKHTAFKLIVALASHIDKDGFTFVTQQTLADDVGIKDRNQVAQQLKVLMESEQPLLIGDRFRNPKTGKYNWMYYLVGCEYIYEEYNYVENDDDINYYLDEDTDNNDVEDVEAVPVEESLFIMPKKVKETVTEDIKELTGMAKLRAYNKQSIPTYTPATIVKEETQEKQDTKDIDAVLAEFKEVHDAPSTYEKPKFIRGSKTSVGSVKKSTEQVENELNDAEDILNNMLG
ncbi:helix-turn-helix domain-containing protein [Priestia aryabhattai]|uniref:helix-turn-helix domain-containing protein n=1 Tax=Priestia aryabhattai TaxID=412384 RepID=UPI0030C93DFA